MGLSMIATKGTRRVFQVERTVNVKSTGWRKPEAYFQNLVLKRTRLGRDAIGQNVWGGEVSSEALR